MPRHTPSEDKGDFWWIMCPRCRDWHSVARVPQACQGTALNAEIMRLVEVGKQAEVA